MASGGACAFPETDEPETAAVTVQHGVPEGQRPSVLQRLGRVEPARYINL